MIPKLLRYAKRSSFFATKSAVNPQNTTKIRLENTAENML